MERYIRSFAAPNEVIALETTGLAGDIGTGLEDRGEHELRGIGDRRLFAIR